MPVPVVPFTPPKLDGHGFNCPHCRMFASQGWAIPERTIQYEHYAKNEGLDKNFKISMCSSCKKICVWIGGNMVYPLTTSVPPPNPDLPADMMADYDEARNILALSPRGSAALLRLAIQKLCKHLGEKGDNTNEDIKSLVKKGLPEMVQQSLDIVRVVGNHAVHPGQIDLKDDKETAAHLFGLVNLITEVMISQPKHVRNLYASVVPQAQQNAIKNRDGV